MINFTEDSSYINRDVPLDKIKFTKQQVAYLEKVFPEKLFSTDARESDLWRQQGIREVVHHVRRRSV